MNAWLNSIPRRVSWFIIIIVMSLLALALTWVSVDFRGIDFQVWFGFLAVMILAAALLYGGWRIVQPVPAWLVVLMLGAVFLRLAIGTFWTIILPTYGYNSPVEQAGYVMKDAYNRDTAAWKLAKSDKPLWTAFTKYRQADQYGGMLYLSAAIYRYLGGNHHQPLQMVVLTAAASSLCILFGWAFIRRLWDEQVADLSAWILAFYPEAVLLGSSQMREAFMISLTSLAFYGLLRYRLDRVWSGMLWVLVALLLSLLFSPPFTALMLAALALLLLALDEWRMLRRKELWLVLGGLAVLAAVGVWLSWGHIAPKGVTNLWDLVNWWLRKASAYQSFLTQQASGWLQREFHKVPQPLHLPFFIIYGVVQPFLPASLVALGAPVWRGIAIWRALGWTLMLLAIGYASLRGIYQFVLSKRQREQEDTRSPATPLVKLTLIVVVWIFILVAALRGGGDQWDNPRYRAIFTCLQVALAAWVIVEQRRTSGTWLIRIPVGLGLVVAWFLPWYIRRYTGFIWQVISVYKTIGLGFASIALLAIWDWVRSQKGGSQE